MAFVAVFVRPSLCSFLNFMLKCECYTLIPGAGTLAFAIRSGINLILLLARIQRALKVPRFVHGHPSVLSNATH
jgi:hypothetical protein